MDGRRDIPAKVKKLREAHGLTQAQLAERSGVGRATLNLLENRKHRPTIQTLEKLASAFNEDVGVFFR